MLCKEWTCPRALAMVLAVCGSFASVVVAADEGRSSKAIQWRTSYAAAAQEAAEQEKPLLVGVTAVWCGPCQQMKQLTFQNTGLAEYVSEQFIPLMIDADSQSQLVSKFQISSYPTLLVISPELKIVKRFTGFQSASTLLSGLKKEVEQRFSGTVQRQVEKREVVDDILPVSATQPANAVSFGFEGFCLVSILDDQKLRRGTPQFITTYKDQEICFHSEEHRRRFLANPHRYWPVANGKCLVSEKEHRETVVGDPRAGVTWRGRLWLFSDKESQRRFIQSPSKYVNNGM